VTDGECARPSDLTSASMYARIAPWVMHANESTQRGLWVTWRNECVRGREGRARRGILGVCPTMDTTREWTCGVG
jgi:hypothetical protein